MKCPTCTEETEGVLNNRKELRCTFCYAVLPPKAEKAAKQVPLDDPDLQAAIKAQNEPDRGATSRPTPGETKKASK